MIFLNHVLTKHSVRVIVKIHPLFIKFLKHLKITDNVEKNFIKDIINIKC